MSAWLSPPGSDLATSVAAWVAVVAAATTLALFCSTLLLRLSTVRAERRRGAVIDRWRRVFAAAMLSEREARECVLPRHARRDRVHLLEEWNRSSASVEGDSAANLAVLARRLDLGGQARTMLRRLGIGTRLLAIQTLGHLGDADEWKTILGLLEHPNTALSVTAAWGLVRIDAREAMPAVMPCVVARADWPAASVSGILKAAGPSLITQPLCNAILTSEAETSIRLLKFAELAHAQRIDQLVELILRERDEPGVLAAAMAAAGTQAGIPRLAALAAHEAWYVRVQAAKLLGRVAQERDLPLLEALLEDRVWWVRYRAAQALVALPFLGPNGLRRLRGRQRDRFAADMLGQAMAEAGLG